MNDLFNDLIKIMSRLRGEKGCPWDRQQTHDSLKPYLIEESYEVLEAIDLKDPKHLAEELGDLLLQVVFHAQIAEEKGNFSIEGVLKGLVEKLIKRHPHVFGGEEAPTAEKVLHNWEKSKMKEKEGIRQSYLDGVPPFLPSLMRAQKVQKKAARTGFDWEKKEDVMAKVEEEWDEFKRALDKKEQDEIEDEMGDLFFTVVNLARTLKLDSEQILRKSTDKFISRFQLMEKEAKRKGLLLEHLTPDEMNHLNRVRKLSLRTK
ncbi:MAG: nucleoside triphosphate pyrophosphohydrolase [Nitrospirae bacterium]|nr:nucleoside triphosphate pyrophosphohydrolase [Nitrospirota bacterium]